MSQIVFCLNRIKIGVKMFSICNFNDLLRIKNSISHIYVEYMCA